MQTMQEKPLVAVLKKNQQTFPGGNAIISIPVQGSTLADVPGFFAGYEESDQLTFQQAENMHRAAYTWKEVHAGLIITETELKKDGVSVEDDMKTSAHSQAELVRLTSLLQNRLEDYGEAWAREFNNMLWRDGSQDTKAAPGVKSILTETPTTGTTGGLSRATYSWWRNRATLGTAVSAANQTLSKLLRSELRQLRRYGGRPDVALCGSDFLEGLEEELTDKGDYTTSGFAQEGKNDLGVANIKMRNLGTFIYDPTLDDLGESKYCYVFDSRMLKLRPMAGEDNRVRSPQRPYDYFVFLRSMTWTGALVSRQLNSSAIYSIA